MEPNQDDTRDDELDELDELVAERTKHNPDFPTMVELALQRRRAARAKTQRDAHADDATHP